jgi:hypothetical protein
MPNYAIAPMTIFPALSQVACRPDDGLEALLRGGVIPDGNGAYSLRFCAAVYHDLSAG